VVDAGPELDLLDLDHLLALARLGRLLLLEKPEFAEVEDLADGRGRIGDDFDQIERRLLGQALGVCEIDDAVIVPLGVYQLDLNCANVAIGSRPAFLRRRGCCHRTTNGYLLLLSHPPCGRTSEPRPERFAPRAVRDG